MTPIIHGGIEMCRFEVGGEREEEGGGRRREEGEGREKGGRREGGGVMLLFRSVIASTHTILTEVQ